MLPLRIFLSLFFFLAALVHRSLVAAQGFRPAAVPLAVRSPYLNAWQPIDAGGPVPNNWPHQVDLKHILGHVVFVRVDGSQFEVIGQLGNVTTLTDVTITPTQTILTVQAGPSLQVTLTYFSPIEPQDLALHSFPFTYVSINAQATDGKPHQVQFYTDISGEWASGSLTSPIHWNTTQTSGGAIIHQLQRTDVQSMQEIDNMPEDGAVYYATMPSNIPTTYQTGPDRTLRTEFTANGKLLDIQDTEFRAVNDRFPVFGFAWDAGTIQDPMTTPVVWAIGIVRDPAVIYTTASGNQTRSSLFFSKFSTVQSGIETFLADFSKAQTRANSLDQKITSAAKAVSSNYADLVSLSMRTVMGSSEITVSKTGATYNTSDVMIFMKDIGVSRRVNPVEVLYASFPTFMYLNATWGKYLLEPLLRYQHDLPSGKPFSISDLGPNFPVASGNTSPAIFRAIDDTSSMLIVAWAQARFSGDASLVERYYDILKSWAEYLIPNTLTPTGYLTSDGLDNSNMTNLAIKGIVGIRVMSEISKSLGANDDAAKYLSTATSYAQQWQTLAGSTGHLKATYDSSSSWSLVYNLFPDKWLGLNLVDSKIYAAQSSWYSSEAASAPQFGLPYDTSDPDTAVAQWTLWAAATLDDNKTRNAMIDLVHAKAADNSTAGVFPASYDPSTGAAKSGPGSPALGGLLSVLALSLPAQTVSGSVVVSGAPSKSVVGPVVGGVLGGFVLLGFIVVFIVICRRRRRSKDPYEDTWNAQPSNMLGLHQRTPSRPTVVTDVENHPPSPTPFPLHRTQPSYSSTTVSSSYGSSSAGLLRGPSTTSRREAPPLPRKGGFRTNELATSPNSEDANVLREEVENLRREMDEMRARGMYEPPPQYV